MANFFRSVLLRLQSKTVTAGTSASTVSTDTGYDGLSSVTVNPTPSETKTQAPGTSDIDVTPTSGKLLSKVTVSAIQTETKSQAAGTSNIDVTPTSGKYLTKVTITPQQHSGYYPSSGSNITSNGTKDLGASHNYRYVNVNISGASITPSNSSPASMTSGTLYTPSANGVAIASYSSITPSDSSPVTLSSGSIYKMSGAGKAVANVNSVTPSNSSPVTLSSGSIYKMGGAGKAVASVTDITPSSTSQSVSSGSVYKMGGNGVVVTSVPTITNITPSNTSPVSMSANSNYKPSTAGYAIQSYQSKTPDTSGVAFDAGIVKMSQGGYAYSEKPSGGFTETTLWTNSAPTSNFDTQTITLSQSIDNFEFLKFIICPSTSMTSESQHRYFIVPVSEFKLAVEGSNNYCVLLGMYRFTYRYARSYSYVSDTQMKISDAMCLGMQKSNKTDALPISVIGLNFAT